MASQGRKPSWHGLSERLRRSKNPRKEERREWRQASVAMAEGRRNTIRPSDWGERAGRERKHKSVQGQQMDRRDMKHNLLIPRMTQALLGQSWLTRSRESPDRPQRNVPVRFWPGC